MISHDGRRWRLGVSRGKGRDGEAVRKDVCLCVLGVEGRGWQRMLLLLVPFVYLLLLDLGGLPRLHNVLVAGYMCSTVLIEFEFWFVL